MNRYDDAFFQALDTLIARSEIVIDRPKGTAHPRYPKIIYPADYGYLSGTASMDGGGIDVWRGTCSHRLDAVICTVDLMKGDAEIKLLIGCSSEETEAIYRLHNETAYMKGILIRRADRCVRKPVTQSD